MERIFINLGMEINNEASPLKAHEQLAPLSTRTGLCANDVARSLSVNFLQMVHSSESLKQR